jgi:RNA polymerase sigma-54 factor
MLHQVKTQLQQFSVLPQQIQLLKLFHLTTLELQQRIQEELNDNPLLEENIAQEEEPEPSTELAQDFQDEEEYQYDDIPDYKLEHHNYLSDNDLPQQPITARFDFRVDLKEQLQYCLKDEKDLALGEYLIDTLNESGMYEQCLEDICDDYSFRTLSNIDAQNVERIREVIKEIEPGGIGCYSIQEFLLFQLAGRTDVEACNAVAFIKNFFTVTTPRNPDKISEQLQINPAALQRALRLIRTLRLKPLNDNDLSGANPTVIPDFIIRKDGDQFDISLYHQRSSTLFVSRSLSVKESDKNPATSVYVKNKINSANWFVDAIKQRESTMQKVMNVIVELQRNYFQEGDIAELRPMILKNVSDRTGVDIATISRITCNKYADTHFGMILLKDLFSEGIENEKGEYVSNRVIQSAIREIVCEEDKRHQLTDQQLVTILSARGFAIARRTVAKYREQMRIPAAQMRSLLVS